MVLSKLAETIEFSIDIPDSEIKTAGRIIMRLEKLSKKLDNFVDHINLLYDPFKKYNTVSEESVHKYRGTLWDYRNKVIENFESLKDIAGVVVKDMKSFNFDTHIVELVSAFTDEVGDIEDQVKFLTDAIANYDHTSYKDNVTSCAEAVKKEVAELNKFIYDRIIDHMNSNILGKNWVEKKHIKFDESEPAVSRLYKEREERLKNIME
jgi:hypothetical protein